MKYMRVMLLLLVAPFFLFAQKDEELVKKVKSKLNQVNSYEANGIIKIDVSFIKAPNSPVRVYYKKPDKFTVKKEGGISILPKGGFSTNLNSLFMTDGYTIVPAGETNLQGSKVKIIKLLPPDESSNIVVATLYIDEKELLIKKSVITTKESGTYEMIMLYGKYSTLGLPDKIDFIFSVKDYKLPKGVTIEYESGEKKSSAARPGNQKGKIEITYSNYVINKEIVDSVFENNK